MNEAIQTLSRAGDAADKLVALVREETAETLALAADIEDAIARLKRAGGDRS